MKQRPIESLIQFNHRQIKLRGRSLATEYLVLTKFFSSPAGLDDAATRYQFRGLIRPPSPIQKTNKLNVIDLVSSDTSTDNDSQSEMEEEPLERMILVLPWSNGFPRPQPMQYERELSTSEQLDIRMNYLLNKLQLLQHQEPDV